MRFLVDEDLPGSLADLIQRQGHEAINVRDTELRGARDETIAAYARDNSLCIVTADLGFADVRNYPPSQYNGLVVLRLPRTATAYQILKLMESFMKGREIVSGLPGKLAIVEFGRVRIREY